MAVLTPLLGLVVILLTATGCLGECTGTGSNSSCSEGSPKRSLKVLVLYPASPVHCQRVVGNESQVFFNESCEIQLSIHRALSEIEAMFPGFSLEVASIELPVECGHRSRYEAIAHFSRAALSGGSERPEIAAVIGPSCSNAAAGIADIIQRGNLPIVHIHTAILPINRKTDNRGIHHFVPTTEQASCVDGGYANDDEGCSNTFGMLGSTEALVEASLSLMQHNNWTSTATVYSGDSNFKRSSVFKQFASAIEKLESSAHSNGNDNLTSLISEFYPHSLSDIKDTDLRIVFVIANAKATREILCLAYQREMYYPAYQWVLVGTLAEEAKTEVSFTSNGESYTCTSLQMEQSLEKAFVIAHQRINVVVSRFQFNETSVRYDSETDIQNITTSVGSLYYDAFWSLATAVNNSLSCFDNTSRHGNASLLPKCIKEDLYSAAGKIQFSRKTGFVQRPVGIDQIQNGDSVQVALYNNTSQNGSLLLSNGEELSAIFYTFRKVPLLVSLPLGVVALVTTVVILIVSIASHVLTIVFRKSATVRASSPKLQNVAYTGYYFLFLALMIYICVKTFAMSDKTYIDLCVLHNYVIFIGLTLLIGTICAKTWRLHRIFKHYLDPGNYLTDRNLTIFILSLTLVDIFMCTLWTIIDLPMRVEISSSSDKLKVEEEGLIQVYSVCDSPFYYSWFAILCAYKLVLLIAALYLALKTRKRIPKSQKKFQMTSVISLIYLICFLLVFGIAFFLVAQIVAMDIIFEVVVWSVLFNLVFVSCVAFLFIPPLVPALRTYMHNRSATFTTFHSCP